MPTERPPKTDKSRERFLAKLFGRYRSELVSRLRKIYGNGPPEPDDIVQTAFSQLAAMNSHEHISDPKAFLFKVALNAGWRSAGHVTATQSFLNEVFHRDGENVENISPDRLYESRERLTRLSNAIEHLSTKQREILIRSRIKGETYQQIAADTGWSIATISRQLTSALEHLATVDAEADEKSREHI